MKTDRGTPTMALSKLLSRYFGAARFAYNSSTDSISITEPRPWPFPVWGSDRREAWQIGWSPSAEHRANLSLSQKGRIFSAETKAKMSLAAKNRSAEARANMSLAHIGKKQSPEAIEKTRAANTGRKHTPERIEKSRIANTGKKRTEEANRRQSERVKGFKHTTEAKARMSVVQKARRAAERTGEVLVPSDNQGGRL